MIRSILRLGAGGLAAALAVAGVGPAGATVGAAGEVTLTVQHLSFLTGAGEVVATAFEAAHPGVDVEIQAITADQFNTNAALLASDDAPDVAMVPFNRTSYTQLVDANMLEPLDDVWAAAGLDDRFPETVKQALLQGGDTPYVITLDTFYYQMVFYQPEVFAELGIAEPADHRFGSFDELVAVVDALHENGIDGIAIAGAESWGMGAFLDPLLATTASDAALANYLLTGNASVPVTAAYTDADFVDAVAAVGRYNDAGIFQDGFLGTKGDQAVALFFAGDTGMYFGGSSDFVALGGAGVDVGWALLPSEGARESQVVGSATDSFGVPVNADNIELAKEFIEFYLTAEMQTEALLTNGLVPVVNDVDPTTVEGVPPGLAEAIGDASANGLQLGWTSTVPGDYGQASVTPLLQALVQGDTIAEQVGQDTQTAFEKWRESDS